MEFIKRDLTDKIIELSKSFSCILLTGSRQVGKTTLLRNIIQQERNYVSLDDLNERNLAQNDPELFLQLHPAPVLIDEVQYAPQLFIYLKIAIDNGAAPGSYWLTGSQIYRLMDLAGESLAGRVAILHMPPLSQHEIFGTEKTAPFTIDLAALQKRTAVNKSADLDEIYRRIWQGAMPGHVSGKYPDRDTFYSSLLQTYISRDVSEMLARVDKLQFQDFIRACACRTGQLLNVHDIALDIGVSDMTAKHWLAILEKSDIIFYLHPYSNNLLKRTVKTPKMYFWDTGLVAYLTKYSTPEILANGALSGAILENYVVAEILKTYLNNAKEPYMWYFRDNKANEIDIVLESDGELHPLEIKRSTNPGSQLIKVFSLLDKASVPRGKGAVLCLRNEFFVIDRDNYIVPVWMI